MFVSGLAASYWRGTGAVHSAAFGDWYFNENHCAIPNFNNCHNWQFTTKNLRKRVFSPADTFIDGGERYLASCFDYCKVATGVSVVMTNGEIQDTIISAGASPF